MAQTIALSPVTRIEGHLGVKVEVDGQTVTNAFVAGEMFRGFEQILRGRDPLDAQHITQRICGVCPIEHGVASVLAQEMAFRQTPAENGRVLRNLLQGANFIASHIAHFYLLSGLDFVDVAGIANYKGTDQNLVALRNWVTSQLASNTVLPAAPFLPRYTAEYLKNQEANFGVLRHYLDAFEMRAVAHKLAAVFAGKMPHAATLVPGGLTEKVSGLKIAQCKSMLHEIRTFIEQCYVPDVVAVATAFPDYFKVGRGCGNFLSYGVFPENADGSKKVFGAGVLLGSKVETLNAEMITEDVASSFFSSGTGRKPAEGETVAAPGKANAYSWLKSPRYQGQVMEVGPLARVLVAYHQGQDVAFKGTVDSLLQTVGKTPADLASVLGRHAARALECRLVAERCDQWLDQLKPDAPSFAEFTVPESGRGYGLTEAARGALGHWIEIRGHKISNYQCVVPTTWNCSPRDDKGNPGAVEQALIGTPIADPQNPIEAARVIRSFDPCLACAVH